MMELFLMVMLSGLAWVHARITVVGAIHQTKSPEQMLQYMLKDTWWTMAMVMLGAVLLGAFSSWVTLYALARSLFLLFTNWHAVCDNYYEIKRLLSGS